MKCVNIVGRVRLVQTRNMASLPFSFHRPAVNELRLSNLEHHSPAFTVSSRGFKHTSYNAFAKKKKGGSGGKGKGNNDSEDVSVDPPDIKDVEKQMEARVTRLKEEFTRMHNSRVSKDMFNHVLVEAYGSTSALPECGQVSVQTASKVVINVFDAALVSSVTKALRDCGLNLNPIVDGSVVSVPVPKASKEKREDMVKIAKKAAEKVGRMSLLVLQLHMNMVHAY